MDDEPPVRVQLSFTSIQVRFMEDKKDNTKFILSNRNGNYHYPTTKMGDIVFGVVCPFRPPICMSVQNHISVPDLMHSWYK